MLKDRIYELERLSNMQPHVAYQHPMISGDYIVLQDFNHVKRGDVVSSQGGWVHGVWHPELDRIIYFFETNYFIKQTNC